MQVTPPLSMPGSVPPPRMYGMPPSGPAQTMANMPGMSQTGPSKIDPNQIPRPLPNSSTIVHETRVGNQANLPPVFFMLLFFRAAQFEKLLLNYYCIIVIPGPFSVTSHCCLIR